MTNRREYTEEDCNLFFQQIIRAMVSNPELVAKIHEREYNDVKEQTLSDLGLLDDN